MNERDPFDNREEDFHQEDFNQEEDRYEGEELPKRRPPKKKGRILPAAGMVVLGLLGGLIGGNIKTSTFLHNNPTPIYEGDRGENITIEPNSSVEVVEAVAKKSLPSVVGITTEGTQNTIFGPVAVQGSGSGFIISEDGYILTNHHVIEGANGPVSVLVNDGTETEGEVVWSDATLDIALVKVNMTGLPAITLGDSDKINIGQIAVAIGNPLGLEFQRSVTAGVISGLNRNVGEVQGNFMEGLIQTDASINSGNSGGPLLNSRGEVVGINTVKLTSGEGIGFAIPINTVKPIVEQVMKTGSYQSVALGISGYSVAQVEQQFGRSLGTDSKGVIIDGVEPGSPAAKAGIEPKDILLRVGDREISSMSELKRILYNYKEGDSETITLIRKGEEKKLNITFDHYELPQMNP